MSFYEVHFNGCCLMVRCAGLRELVAYLDEHKINPEEIRRVAFNIEFIDLEGK